MRLYHGSNMAIGDIDLACSKPNKDFGRAFYLSASQEQAEEMASFKADFLGGTPIVMEYEFDENVLLDGTVSFKQFDDYCEEWAQFVYDHRTEPYGLTFHKFDIVYGPIANDRVGAQIANYRNGDITFQEFLRRLHYMKGITFQYAFCTPLAISKLVRL